MLEYGLSNNQIPMLEALQYFLVIHEDQKEDTIMVMKGVEARITISEIQFVAKPKKTKKSEQE